MDRLVMLLPLAWRNLWRNPRRTVVTFAIVTVGLYSVLVLGSLLEAWAQSSRNASLSLLIGSGQIHATGYLEDPTVAQRMPPPKAALRKVLKTKSVDAWVCRVRVPSVVKSEYKTLPITFLGVEPDRESQISKLPHQIIEGRYITAKDDMGIVLGNHLAQRLKTRVGKRVVIMSQSKDGHLAERAFQVVGLFGGNQNAEDTYAFTGLETSQAMLNIGSEISEISFVTKEDTAMEHLLTQIKSAAPRLQVSSWRELAPLIEAMDLMMYSMIFIWLSVMCSFMCIGIVNTQLMAVFERTREFGLLQALGMQPRWICVQVLLESAMLISIGVVTSLITAIFTIFLLKDGVDLGFLAQGAAYFGAGHILYPQISLGQFMELSGVVLVIGVFVTLWPAIRASRSNPLEAMRHA